MAAQYVLGSTFHVNLKENRQPICHCQTAFTWLVLPFIFSFFFLFLLLLMQILQTTKSAINLRSMLCLKTFQFLFETLQIYIIMNILWMEIMIIISSFCQKFRNTVHFRTCFYLLRKIKSTAHLSLLGNIYFHLYFSEAECFETNEKVMLKY